MGALEKAIQVNPAGHGAVEEAGRSRVRARLTVSSNKFGVASTPPKLYAHRTENPRQGIRLGSISRSKNATFRWAHGAQADIAPVMEEYWTKVMMAHGTFVRYNVLHLPNLFDMGWNCNGESPPQSKEKAMSRGKPARVIGNKLRPGTKTRRVLKNRYIL